MPVLGSLVTIAVLGGTSAGLLTSARSGDALGLAIAFTTAVITLQKRALRSAAAIAAVVCAGAAHGAAARDLALRPPIVSWFDAASDGNSQEQPATIVGLLATDAAATTNGIRLLIDVERPAAGRVLVHVSGELAARMAPSWTAGRRIRAPVTLRRPQTLLNFGGPSPFWQSLRRSSALIGSIKSGALVEVERGRWWNEAAAAARRYVRESITMVVGARSPQSAAIVTAVLIGDRAGLDDDLERRLQAAGTYHVIAISGGNVALLLGFSIAALRIVLRQARAVSIAALGLVVIYGFLVGGDPSVSRAVTAASLYLLATICNLVPAPVAIVRSAAIVLVLVDPLNVIDPGAWLSFGATLGIVVLATRWARSWTGAAWPRLGHVSRALVTLVVATLAAESAIAPVSASVFGRVSTAGVLLNLVAIPAMAVIQAAGIGVVVLRAVLLPAAVLCGRVAHVATDALVGSSDFVEIVPWVSWRVPPSPPLWIAAYYLAGLAYVRASTVVTRRIALAAAAILIGVIVSAPASGPGPKSDRVRVTVLDVGQGDAILVQAPGNRSLLVDTGGSAGTFDIGGRVVTPAAWALGVRRLTWLALTHGDRDHAGGAPAVVQDLTPGEIWEGVPVPRDPERARLREIANRLHVPWRTVQAGDRIEIDRLTIEAVRPPPPDWERQKVRNDDSIVLRLHVGLVDVWLTGDAGAEFESRLPADAGRAAIRVLKVGHHGSRTSTGAALVNAIRPQIAVISVGRGNLFGHPAPDVLARLAAAGAEIFRTDRDGAVVLEIDRATARVSTPTGRQWSVGVIGR